MKRYQVTFVSGHVEEIAADDCWPNDWGAAFLREIERPSKSFAAKPGDTVSKLQTFRFIAGRLINEIREVM